MKIDICDHCFEEIPSLDATTRVLRENLLGRFSNDGVTIIIKKSEFNPTEPEKPKEINLEKRICSKCLSKPVNELFRL